MKRLRLLSLLLLAFLPPYAFQLCYDDAETVVSCGDTSCGCSTQMCACVASYWSYSPYFFRFFYRHNTAKTYTPDRSCTEPSNTFAYYARLSAQTFAPNPAQSFITALWRARRSPAPNVVQCYCNNTGVDANGNRYNFVGIDCTNRVLENDLCGTPAISTSVSPIVDRVPYLFQDRSSSLYNAVDYMMNVCKNYAGCRVQPGFYPWFNCACRPGFTGQYCETPLYPNVTFARCIDPWYNNTLLSLAVHPISGCAGLCACIDGGTDNTRCGQFPEPATVAARQRRSFNQSAPGSWYAASFYTSSDPDTLRYAALLPAPARSFGIFASAHNLYANATSCYCDSYLVGVACNFVHYPSGQQSDTADTWTADSLCNAFDRIVPERVDAIAGTRHWFLPACANGAGCVITDGGFFPWKRCFCTPGWTGTFCELPDLDSPVSPLGFGYSSAQCGRNVTRRTGCASGAGCVCNVPVLGANDSTCPLLDPMSTVFDTWKRLPPGAPANGNTFWIVKTNLTGASALASQCACTNPAFIGLSCDVPATTTGQTLCDAMRTATYPTTVTETIFAQAGSYRVSYYMPAPCVATNTAICLSQPTFPWYGCVCKGKQTTLDCS